MDFTTMDISTITTGKTGDGVRYLELFLQEYTRTFNESVNAGCSKCIQSYITKYQNKMKESENTSAYRLQPKYENIPLEFGSAVLVNNGNITDEYAKKLLKSHPRGEELFAKMPEAKVEPKAQPAKKGNAKKLPADKQDINEIEVTLTEDDLAGNSELAESHKAGDVVIISKKEYELDGTISIVDKKQE